MLRIVALTLGLTCLLDGRSAAGQPIAQACDAAAARAERAWDIPSGVLAAVGTVESGYSPTEHGRAPWPWTINAAGRGSIFPSKQEAIEAVLVIMRRGYPYIDVGCFQVDILYHAGVFRSLEDAFDPDRNAMAAARILSEAHRNGFDWPAAVARYHSANDALGLPYLNQVRAAFPGARMRAALAEYAQAVASASDGARNTMAETSPAGTPRPRVIYAQPTPEDLRPWANDVRNRP